MSGLLDLMADKVVSRLQELSWKCRDCPKVEECEDQDGLVRYCTPIIIAAITDKESFEIVT